MVKKNKLVRDNDRVKPIQKWEGNLCLSENIEITLKRAKHLERNGQLFEALGIYQSLVKKFSMSPLALSGCARILSSQGNIAKAAELVVRCLEIEPGNPEVLYSAGLVQNKAGNFSFALECLNAALKIVPNDVDTLTCLVNILLEQNRWQDALPFLERLTHITPNNADILLAIGTAHLHLNNFETASDHLHNAVFSDPDDERKWINLGVLQRKMRRNTEAERSFQQALKLNPSNVENINNIITLYVDLHRFVDAQWYIKQARLIDPYNTDTLNCLAYSYMKKGLINDAQEIYQQVLAIEPDHADACLGYGTSLLLQGNFTRGLPYYESRFSKIGSWLEGPWPVWNGLDAYGKRILVRSEQGAGDTIQFCRLLPMLKKLGAQTIFLCQPIYGHLLENFDGVDTLIAAESICSDTIQADAQIALMSLMGVLGITMETIPGKCPYLFADEKLVFSIKKFLPKSNKLKVGLIWAGNPEQLDDHNRSLHLSQLKPLSVLRDNVQFYSLQMGYAKSQIDEYGSALGMIDLSPYITNFDDTAAFMAHMDLIVSVCTSTIHLAGALGRPGVVLLHSAADWRWFLGREDSPWYPTIHLLRQSGIGQWKSVIDELLLFIQQKINK